MAISRQAGLPSTFKSRWMNRTTAVTLAVFCYWLALYLYGSTLPIYVKGKVDDLALTGSVLAMYGLWQMIARLPVGIAADWAGRHKPFILAGLAFVAVGAWGLGHAQDAGGLTLARALTGLGAATWVPLLVFFNNLYPPEQAFRATGLVTLICNLARMVGTGANGPINTISGGYETAFNLAALVGAIAIGLMLFIPERPQAPRAPAPRRLLALFIRPDVIGPAVLNMLLHYGDWSATYSFIPILARQYGASDVTISVLTSANLGVVALGNITVTWLGPRLRFWPMLMLSFGLVAAGLGLAAIAPALAVVIAAQLLIGIGFGIAYPVLLGACIRNVNAGERTTAMGLNQAVYAAGMFAGPWLSGILASALGVQPMFGITAAVLLIASTGGVRALKARSKEA